MENFCISEVWFRMEYDGNHCRNAPDYLVMVYNRNMKIQRIFINWKDVQEFIGKENEKIVDNNLSFLI
jgi:hypothetical protein